MSHSKLRSEKVCLNCGTETLGRYCPACGQENIEPRQTVWHLITHFFADITHFDGKFFLTVKDLFLRPGFLSREYMLGRRARYLDPIRMYIFTSAFFFLIFFSLFNTQNLHVGGKTLEDLQKDPDMRELMSAAKNRADSLKLFKFYNDKASHLISIDREDTSRVRGWHIRMQSAYPSIGAYDSAQRMLAPADRDGWLNRKFAVRRIVITSEFDKDPEGMIRETLSRFFHNFPKALFISLPLFALILKLLYARRKSIYYVDHGIFSIHLYIFSFLVLLLAFMLEELRVITGWSGIFWLIGLLAIYAFVYYYKSMRVFYGQERGKTLLKYLLLLFLSAIVQLILFIFAFAFTVIEA